MLCWFSPRLPFGQQKQKGAAGRPRGGARQQPRRPAGGGSAGVRRLASDEVRRIRDTSMVQNQGYHFGIGALPILLQTLLAFSLLMQPFVLFFWGEGGLWKIKPKTPLKPKEL